MKNVLRGAAAAGWLLIAAACPALAQSSPGWSKGKVPTAGEWNAAFAAKQDALGYVPLNVAGGVMTGRLITAPPGAATSGLNLSPGAMPANPANGDLWVTPAGLFVRVGGVTIGPLSGGTTSSFAATAPLNVSFPGNIVTYGLNIDSTLTVQGGNLGLRLPNPNTWTGLQTFSAGVSIASAFSAPGLVKNSDLVNASTSVNGQTCALGGACTINASATSITIGITAITSGVSARVLFDAAGLLGEFTISGSGSVAMTNSPTFVTPTLGAAVGTSLSLGGATIGDNALAVNGAETIASASAAALAIGANGATNPAFLVDASAASQAAGFKVTGAATGGTVALAAIDSGANTNLSINAKGTGGISIGNVSTGGIGLGNATAIQSAGVNALAVGPNGATNPVLQVNGSIASSVTGITLNGAGAGNGVGIGVLSPNANETLIINAKGTSPVQIGQSGGGVQVLNSFTALGLVTYADMATAALANASQYFSGAANTLVPASVIYQAESTTTFASSITFDFSTFINTGVTLTGNITAMTLANVKAGQAGTIALIQDGAGGRTAVFNSIFKFAGGATPTLSSAPNAIDVISYSCRSATFCVASLLQNVR